MAQRWPMVLKLWLVLGAFASIAKAEAPAVTPPPQAPSGGAEAQGIGAPQELPKAPRAGEVLQPPAKTEVKPEAKPLADGPDGEDVQGTVVYGSLKFDESAFDFGEVYRGSELVHKFRFVNVGQGPLTIQGVHAACGCAAVGVEKGHKYQPGEAGLVEVKLDTTNFAGVMDKSVTVMSNEKLLPDRTLTLKAYVKTEIEADPPLVDFGDVRSQEGGTRVVRIKAIGPGKREVKEVLFNRDVLETSLARDQNDWLLTVKLKPGLTPGFLKEMIVVRNNSVHLHELPVPVRATILGNIDLAPLYLEFGAIGPSETAKRSLTMHGMVPFEVTGTRAELIINGRRIDDAASYIKIATLPHEKDKRLVQVELKNGSKVAGSVHGKLYIQTTDPGQKELAVDFYAFFR